MAKTSEVDPASHAASHDDGSHMGQPKDANYGEWMLVTKKKKKKKKKKKRPV